MVNTTLTSEQISILEKYGKDFQTWLTTDKGIETLRIHRDHQDFFQKNLSVDNIDNMQENEFSEIYKKLWASNIWQNKDWYIQNKLLEPNGIEQIKKELKKLLYSDDEIPEKYNEFKSNIKGFGIASLSEILHMVFPEKYCLWNNKPKTVLPELGLNIMPKRYFKYSIKTGEEYFKCMQSLELIKNQLTKFGIIDFIDLDVMLWHIYEDILPTMQKEDQVVQEEEQIQTIDETSVKIDSHTGAQYHLLQLGDLMGYFTYTADPSSKYQDHKLGDISTLKETPEFIGEKDLKSARNMDVIWFGPDDNPKVCFEVEHSTGITPGLNRLFQLIHMHTKFVIISSPDMKAKFDREMKKLPYRTYCDRFQFISYDKLEKLLESAKPFYELKTELLGQDV